MILYSKKNGFTLVELLAVIVILAVLVVLAMPSVLKIMNNAKQSAFETEVRSYLKAAQTKYVEKQTLGNSSSTMYFSSEGSDTNNCNSVNTACKVDIDDKTNYKYIIRVMENSDGAIVYRYYLENNEFSSGSYKNAVTNMSFTTARDNLYNDNTFKDVSINDTIITSAES